MLKRAMLDTRTLDEKAARIAKQTNSTPGRVKAVLIAAMMDTENLKQPKAPAPAGGISICAAARKYEIPHGTLTRWTQKGYITILCRTKNETYINESQAAMVISEYKKNPGRGKYTLRHKLSAT